MLFDYYEGEETPPYGRGILVTDTRHSDKTVSLLCRDEVIAELESEKATFEVNAEKAGILTTIGKEGDTLNIGDVLANIDETAAKPEGAPATSVAPTPAASVRPAAARAGG